jgi:hypothetical protein
MQNEKRKKKRTYVIDVSTELEEGLNNERMPAP